MRLGSVDNYTTTIGGHETSCRTELSRVIRIRCINKGNQLGLVNINSEFREIRRKNDIGLELGFIQRRVLTSTFEFNTLIFGETETLFDNTF